MYRSRQVLCSLLLFALSGCATTLYHWGDYDSVLYHHYRNPQDPVGFATSLGEIVAQGEARGRVPPGLYAEYGYALYEVNRYEEAIANFEKERARWPESAEFMEKMIAMARRQGDPTP